MNNSVIGTCIASQNLIISRFGCVAVTQRKTCRIVDMRKLSGKLLFNMEGVSSVGDTGVKKGKKETGKGTTLNTIT